MNEYYFFAGYVVLQFVVLATAWNILGGYAGYVNFGTGAFFGVGAYTAVLLIKATGAPLGVQILAAAAVGGTLGFGVGLLTLRLRGIFFSIATVAVAIILETVILNWRYVGGATGVQILRPAVTWPFDSYITMLFTVGLALAVVAVLIARYIETSWLGRGLRAIRDNEEAAECSGVPTLRLKLMACAVSGALMSAAGAPLAMYQSYVEPVSSFSLNYSVSALAMPLIGGTAHWIGPVLGALLLGIVQQVVTVTVSSELNVLVVGVLLVVFVVAAPDGIVGLYQKVFPTGKNKK
jgi:branched-chain amino acid transport system permease protein